MTTEIWKNPGQSAAETSAGDGAPTPEQLEKINRLARRKLAPEEVFVFSVILCDNEIDRDCERFPVKSLEALSRLYLGKTGLFDHSARAESQSARIFETLVEVDENRQTQTGEPYACLRAKAYMARCAKNEDLIFEIDAGIKKEVSVGCAVEEILCSVCGESRRKKPCSHKKGERYGGVLCHDVLCGPTDAYEWSFVAVPAQRNAGVTKGLGPGAGGNLVERVRKAAGALELSHAEVKALREHLDRADALAGAGEEYARELRGEMVRMAALAQPELDCATVEEVSGLLTIPQLKAFIKGWQRPAAEALPRPQLAPARSENRLADDHPFKI